MEAITIGSRRITVTDRGVLSSTFGIDRIHLSYQVNRDMSESIVVYRGGPKSNKVYKNSNSISFNTPSFFKRYVGEKIIVYKEIVDRCDGELFRVDPLNFTIEKAGKIPDRMPYFTKSSLVFPRSYLNNIEGVNVSRARVSFSLTTDNLLHNGYILVYIHYDSSNSISALDHKIKSYYKGMRTSSLSGFYDFIGRHGVDVSSMKYEGTVAEDGYKHGVIAFKHDRG